MYGLCPTTTQPAVQMTPQQPSELSFGGTRIERLLRTRAGGTLGTKALLLLCVQDSATRHSGAELLRESREVPKLEDGFLGPP